MDVHIRHLGTQKKSKITWKSLIYKLNLSMETLIYEAILVGVVEVAFVVYFIFEIIKKSKE